MTDAAKEENLAADINVNTELAMARYLAGRKLDTVIPFLEKSLQRSSHQAEQVKAFKQTGKGLDNDIRRHLTKRLDRAQLEDKLRLAYIYAQEGVNWHFALQYARENYDLYRTHKRPVFQCIDDYKEFEIFDTYAYVKLAFQGHNFQSDRTPPDADEVREARSILESAINNLRRHEDDLDNNRARICSDHERTKQWLVRLNSHLKLSEAMLR